MIEYIYQIVIQHKSLYFFWIVGHCNIHLTETFISVGKYIFILFFFCSVSLKTDTMFHGLYIIEFNLREKKTGFQISLPIYMWHSYSILKLKKEWEVHILYCQYSLETKYNWWVIPVRLAGS